MTPEAESKTARGVLLTVDARSYSADMIDLAVAIAASTKSPLHGLFVEDEDLLRAVSLPFAREISFTTAHEYPTDIQRMQRSLRALASQFETALNQSARAADIICTHEYARGRRGEIDIFKPQMAFTIFDQALLHRARRRLTTGRYRILLIEDHSPNVLQVLKVILQRIHDQPVEIIHYVNERSLAESLSTTMIDEGFKNVHLTEVKSSSTVLDSLLASNAQKFDYAILARNQKPDLIRQVVSKLDCPVILVA